LFLFLLLLLFLSVQVLYFTNYLQWSDSRATVMYHVFIMMCYLTAIMGGMLADSPVRVLIAKHCRKTQSADTPTPTREKLGKQRTILYLSLVYCLGNFTMSLTAIPAVMGGGPPHWWGAGLALLLIAFGTGLRVCWLVV
jgi:dipeptide/tripeptide permease